MSLKTMEFEWDDVKNQTNIEKHGVQFKDAVRIFDGFTVGFIDDRNDYGEVREISIGMIDDIAVIVVVHTDRNGICRIISARQANRKERIRYDETLRQSLER